MARHLISSADLSRSDVEAILDTAASMHDVQRREVKKLPTLRADDRDMCGHEAHLPCAAYFLQQNMPCITVEQDIIEAHGMPPQCPLSQSRPRRAPRR